MCIRTGVVFVESAMSYFDHLRPNTILLDCTLTLNQQVGPGSPTRRPRPKSRIPNPQMSTVVHIGDHNTTHLTSSHAQTRMTICSSTVAQTQMHIWSVITAGEHTNGFAWVEDVSNSNIAARMRCSATCPSDDGEPRTWVQSHPWTTHTSETAGGTNVSTRAYCASKRTTTVGTLLDLVLRDQIGQRMLDGSINVKTEHVKLSRSGDQQWQRHSHPERMGRTSPIVPNDVQTSRRKWSQTK